MLQPLSGKEDGSDGGSTPGMARVAMDGTYEVTHVAAGQYAVIAILPGYLSPLDELSASGFNMASESKLRAKLAAYNSVTVRQDAAATEDVVLERGAAVSGRVLYPDGSPATQVTMHLENVDAKPGKKGENAINLGDMMRLMFTRQSTGTDDQGHFRLSGLAPGTYRLAAMPAPVLSSAGDDAMEAGMLIGMGMMTDTAALHVYAGDTLHQKDAKTFTLRGGDEVADIQITLPINSFHAVSGMITAKDGRPLSLAKLTLIDSSDDTVRFSVELADNGSFRFSSVPTGTYQLTASDGQIVMPNPKLPASMAVRSGTAVAAFAEGSTPVLVKDSDVTDVTLALAETALKPVPKPADDAEEN